MNVFRVYVTAGTDPLVVRQRMLERLAPKQPRLLVLTNAEVRGWVLQLTDQWLQLTYSQVFIAVIVAILGIVNTLTVSIIDRKRELGVLRAVGGFPPPDSPDRLDGGRRDRPGRVSGSACCSARPTCISFCKSPAATCRGCICRTDFLSRSRCVLLPTILGAACFSALWPAESAVRMSLVEALEYE